MFDINISTAQVTRVVLATSSWVGKLETDTLVKLLNIRQSLTSEFSGMAEVPQRDMRTIQTIATIRSSAKRVGFSHDHRRLLIDLLSVC